MILSYPLPPQSGSNLYMAPNRVTPVQNVNNTVSMTYQIINVYRVMSHFRTMLLDSSSRPLPAQRPPSRNFDFKFLYCVRGRSQMTSAKFSVFLTPFPPCQHVGSIYILLKSRNLPYCIRIWVTPSLPFSTDVICEWSLIRQDAEPGSRSCYSKELKRLSGPSLP